MKVEKSKEIFQSVIKQNKGILFKVANLYCKDHEDRKDLMQEMTIQLWYSFDKYNSEFKISTWMYRIALNVAISFYRKDSRRKDISMPMSEVVMDIIPERGTDENDIELNLLHQFISELNELDKALILLYLEEKSYKEISKILGISETNISTKIGRIKEKLKLRFEKI